MRIRLDGEGRAYTASVSREIRVSTYDGTRWTAAPVPAWPGASVGLLADFALVPSRRGVVAALATSRGGLCLLQGNVWKRKTAAGGLPSDTVLALATAGSTLYVGTDAGLALHDPQTGETTLIALPGAPQSAIHGLAFEPAPSGDTLWIQGDTWLGTLREGRFALITNDVTCRPALRGLLDLRLAPDRRGGLFTGNADALYHVDGASGRVRKLGIDSGLVSHGADALLVDREESLWVGSPRGVCKLSSMAFASYQHRHGLLEDEVTALLERPDGTLVLGHNIGLTLLHGERPVLIPMPAGQPPVGWRTRVMDLDGDPDGSIWVAASERGVLRLDGSGRITTFGPAAGLADRITSVRVDHEGRLWAAGDMGLYLRRGQRFSTVDVGTGQLHARRLFLGRDGALHLATLKQGLLTLRGGSWHQARSEEGGDADSIYALLAEDDGTVWIGSAAGLFRLEGERLVRSTAPRVDRPVYFVRRDGRGWLWAGTDFGVVRWDGHEARRFTVGDGLAGNETNRAAGLVDRLGRVWIGTDRGVSLYDPAQERRPAPPPLLSPLSFQVNGRDRPLTGPLRLHHHESALSFRWRAVSLLDETSITFESLLEGHDAGWQRHVGTTRHESRYAGLGPGVYRYRIRARSADGAWSAVATSPPIAIARPFWRSWWFFALLSLAAAGILLAVQSSVVERRTTRRLEQEVESRTASLLASERKLLATLESIADGVISIDRAGKVLLLNAAAERLTGWTDAEAAGQPLPAVAPLFEPASGAALEPVALILASTASAPFVASCELARRDGAVRLVEIAGSAVRDAAGEGAGVVLAMRDVTERRRVEEELAKGQRLESLGILAGGLAHDLNNLLTVILGNLSLLRSSGGLAGDDLQCLEDAESASLRARDLAHRLLTFAKGGAPVTESAAPAELVHESLRLALSGSRVKAEVSLAPDLWNVEVDRAQMGQVLNNLLLNAVQAMPGGGRVFVRGENLEGGAGQAGAPGRRVHLSIRDEGPGIPRELTPKIFDPFFTTKTKGSGLGLTIAYSVVKSHGGSLSVESEAGAGSTFHLTLPAAPERARPAAAGAEATGAPPSRILVMDDDGAVRKVLGTMLEQQGHEPTFAADGAEAVELHQAALAWGRPFDLLILDLTVPDGMGGAEAARRILSAEPGARVIATSGYTEDNAMREYRSHGFTGVLPKPYRFDELARVLGEALAAGRPSHDASPGGGPA